MDMPAILSAVDDHGFEDTITTRKVQVANSVLGSVCSREPWSFLEKSAPVTLSTQAVPLPADFRASLSVIIPSIGMVLQPERLDTTVKNWPSALALPGVPQQYYFIGPNMMVRPVPNASYSATLYYLCHHGVVTATTAETDILVPAGHHQVIVDGILARLYAMEDDPENAQLFTGFFEQGIREMADTWKRQYDLPDRVVDVWENGDGWY